MKEWAKKNNVPENHSHDIPKEGPNYGTVNTIKKRSNTNIIENPFQLYGVYGWGQDNLGKFQLYRIPVPSNSPYYSSKETRYVHEIGNCIGKKIINHLTPYYNEIVNEQHYGNVKSFEFIHVNRKHHLSGIGDFKEDYEDIRKIQRLIDAVYPNNGKNDVSEAEIVYSRINQNTALTKEYASKITDDYANKSNKLYCHIKKEDDKNPSLEFLKLSGKNTCENLYKTETIQHRNKGNEGMG